MPSRHAGDNARRTIVLIDLSNKFPRPALILSLNAQKTFDGLIWPYMFSTLKRFGFRGPFLKSLQALYSKTSAQVQMASFLLPLLPMSNGIRQRCPLSPLLFILCPEPLAEAIRTHSDISGVLMQQREYTLSLFANDILSTLMNPIISLLSLHALLHSFGAISGYKVNTAKTDALPLHIPPDLLVQLKSTYPYK